MPTVKDYRRLRIRRGIRKKIAGSDIKPRLSVFRSNKEIYAQLVDDVSGVTIASATSKKIDAKGSKVEISAKVGQELAKAAKDKGIDTCTFDRGGYLYHGRVKALADGAREGGLKF